MSNDRHRQLKKNDRRRNRTAPLPKQASEAVDSTCSNIDPVATDSVSTVATNGIPQPVSTMVEIESIENLLSAVISPEPVPAEPGPSEIKTQTPIRSPETNYATSNSTSNSTVSSHRPLSHSSSSHTTMYSQSDSKHWSEAVDTKLNSLIEQTKAFERERIDIEALREHLKQAIETAEARLKATSSDAGINRINELETQLAAVNRENAKLATLLLNTRNEYQDLVDFIESEPADSYEDDDDNEDNEDSEDGYDDDFDEGALEAQIQASAALEQELRHEIEQLNEQLKFLQQELTDANSRPTIVSSDESELRIQIEKLRSQLLDARHEAVESRLQNNELSSSLARYKGPNEGQHSEALSWEQRKEALLRQLEAETHADEPCDPRKILEIERVIKQTDDEIARRDSEIADLRSLLEQQAIAQNGMAIGVAAVAEMIESDALIIAERLRLQELQQEWEHKQRHAEIEMSLERAKLARERLELQEKLQSFEENHPPETEDEKKNTKERGRGRWLARLGLRDE
jgi:hypothetical protein